MLHLHSALTWVAQRWGAVACAIFFFLLGLVFISRTGIEDDEAIFAVPLFLDWCFYGLPLGPHLRLPLMHMSYLGALKTWLYTPLFAFLAPTPEAIRVPAVLLGAATIVLFWLLLERVHSRAAAFAGSVLLATDTIFLLTTTYDWGPVALQHLLTVAAMLFAVRWYQSGRQGFLAAAAYCCGLAFWDKAIFGWMFAGMCAGSLIFARGIRRRMTFRGAALAIAALLGGALPVIVYNLAATPRFATIRSNARFTPGFFAAGWRALRATWNGSGLLGIAHYAAPHAGTPQGVVEQASFYLHAATGEWRTNFIEAALVVGLLVLLLRWRSTAREAMLFALVAGAIGLIAMLLSGGGLSVHHTILLWPLPVFFLANAFGEVPSRVGLVVLCFLGLSNLLVTNQYLYQFVRYGSSDVWTDAIYPLAAALSKTHASQAVITDWGIADQLCVLNRNDPPARPIAFRFMPPGDPPAQREADLRILADEKAIWVEHMPGHEVFKGANDHVLNAAREAGFSPVMLDTFYDRNGRAIFQTLRFVSSAQQPH